MNTLSAVTAFKDLWFSVPVELLREAVSMPGMGPDVTNDVNKIMIIDGSPGISVGDMFDKPVDQKHEVIFLTKHGMPMIQTPSSRIEISRQTFAAIGKLKKQLQKQNLGK